MQIELNGKRNITLDFDAPKKFKLFKDGAEVPYIRTGKNSFRLGRNVDGVIELEEIIEKPKIVKPMQLQPQQMALVNPNDVLMINQAAQQLEIEQGLLSETQKQIGYTQEYLDIQQQNINEAVAGVKALETDNAERIAVTEGGIFKLAGEIANVENNANNGITLTRAEIESHENADNPHGITKKTIGLDKVDNTPDLDKPISKAVQSALDEKADKTDIQAIREEIGEYQEKNEKISNALSSYTGGLASASDHRELEGRDFPDQHPIGAITGLQNALDGKVNKTNSASKVYGTDSDGNQTLYNAESFGQVDDVKVNGESVVEDKVANLGSMALKNASDYSTKDEADTLYASISYEETINNHIADTNNPHEVTKSQVGLGNVDDTSDLDKPISTATQTALDGKANKATTLAGYGITDTYTKTEVDTALSGKQASLDTTQMAAVNSGINSTKVEQITTNTNDISSLQSNKADKATTLSGYGITDAYTKTEVDTALNNKQNTLTTAQLNAVNSGIDSTKVAQIATNKSDISNLQSGKADKATTLAGYGITNAYTKTEVDNALSNKADKATTLAGYGITNAYTKTEVDTALSGKQNNLDTTQMAAVNSGANTTNIGQIATNTSDIGTINGKISSAASTSNQLADKNYVDTADNNLQSQIDAIVSSSDVFDIVGTYAELQAYDISTVPVNDIIKVLVDSTHGGAATYYRCVETGGVKSWSYIGSEGAYYTKSETDTLLQAKQDEITSSNKLSADLVDDTNSTNKFVTASDISTWNAKQNALTAGTGIDITSDTISNSGVRSISTGATNGTISVNTNGTSVEVAVYGLGSAAYTASTAYDASGSASTAETNAKNYADSLASNYATAAQGALADTALQSGDNISELFNNAGYITGITSSDVTTALGYTPYNSSNPSGYQANVIETVKVNGTALTPTNKAVDVTVPTKTSDLTNDDGFITGITSSDVTTALGYTPYDSSNPSGYTSNVGTVTSVNNTSPDSNGNVTLSIPAAQVNSDWNAVSGVAEILNKPTLGTMASESASDYTPTSGLAAVATSGAYSDLSGTPTIPTVNNATLTITQGGVSKGTFTANALSDVTIALDSGGGSSYTAGTGIDITNNVISVDGQTVSEVTLADVATSGDYDDLINKPVSRNIGEVITSSVPLTDAGLHLLDGSLIQGSGSYSAFVTYMAGLVTDYPDLFETEANWQTSVTNYGSCGKFVYDSINNTVRLPKITGFTEGTIDPTALGDLTEAGLPNITGKLDIRGDGSRSAGSQSVVDGAFEKHSQSTNIFEDSNAGGGVYFTFDASKSNSIYGNSSTVQPQSIKVLYYIVIATSTKTDIEVDIDEVMTDLNGKADVDLTNINNSGTSLSAGWAMPSNTYDNLTLGASSTLYTAPANGYVYISMTGTGVSGFTYISLYNSTKKYGVKSDLYRNSTSTSFTQRCFLSVSKGDSFTLVYNMGTISSTVFYFIYAKGSESEA